MASTNLYIYLLKEEKNVFVGAAEWHHSNAK